MDIGGVLGCIRASALACTCASICHGERATRICKGTNCSCANVYVCLPVCVERGLRHMHGVHGVFCACLCAVCVIVYAVTELCAVGAVRKLGGDCPTPQWIV